ncbi:MAG: restriction endonuclease subunit S [Nitrosomonas sp.]|nr:restriction endonuclease subunit S [Nitrosomonas sp.]
MSFPCYESYKDSGVEWLNTIPNHWIDLPLKAVASHNNDVLDERTADDYEILYVDISSVNPINGITSKEAMPFSAAPSRARRRVKHGDVIVSTVRTYLRAIARINEPEESLVVSTGFCVVRPSGRVFHGFLGYLLSSSYFVDAVISHSVGVSYPAINASALVGIKVPLPSIPEQQTIATFLDRETAKIDALITEQQRLIELLKEKRQSVISHAVTKGLNPNVPMKNLGIEWLGEVPEHWKNTRIKHIAKPGNKTFVDGDWIEAPYITTDGVRLIQCGNIGTGIYEEQGFRYVSEETLINLACTEVNPNDILICRLQSSRTILAGRACLAPNLGVKMITSVDNCIVKPSLDFDPKYIVYLLSTSSYLSYIETVARGGTRDRISRSMLGNIELIAPPVTEQTCIADYLECETTKLDTLTTEAKTVITLLQERRTALISAAVTGKIDVRGLVSAKTEVKAETVPC